MLHLTPQQTLRLHEVASARLKERVVVFVNQQFPERCLASGGERIRGAVEDAAARATELGFETDRQICMFVVLALELGACFDEDPLIPGFGRLVRNTSIDNPRVLLNVLYHRAEAYLTHVHGSRYERLCGALERLQREAGDGPENAEDLARRLHPEKHPVLNSKAAQSLIHLASQGAQRYGLHTAHARRFYMGLLFVLGSSFDTDRQYPWKDIAPRGGTDAIEAMRVYIDDLLSAVAKRARHG